MTRYSSRAIVSGLVTSLAVIAFLPAGAAQAQWYSSVSQRPAPLYPYSIDRHKPYAVEVAPNTYVIRRPSGKRETVYTRRVMSESVARRDGGKRKHAVVHTANVVRDEPVVIEHKRYVDDSKLGARKSGSNKKSDDKRVIRAEAEITILGPDRMSIRLFRKGTKASASVE